MRYKMDPIRFLKEQYEWLKGSGDNKPGGASSKKLTAFGAFIVSTLVTLSWAVWAFLNNDWTLLPIILPMWLAIIYGALQINSSEKKKGVENKSVEDEPKG